MPNKASHPRIVVILPAYNEEQTIAATIEDFHTELPEADIWVIDNASQDNTHDTAVRCFEKLGLKDRGGVLTESRKGKGNAIRKAFLELDADAYVLADADLTYPASQVRELLAPVLGDKADMVVGDRHSSGRYATENKRILHGFGNKLVIRLVNTLFQAKLKDIMSGYRVFNRRFVKSYPITAEGFEIETDMTLHALDKRFRIVEIPVEYKDRPEGSFSKLHTLSDGTRVIKTISNILRYYRPLFFFGGASLIVALTGILTGIPVLMDWFRYRYIYHIPLAILSTGIELIALILFSIGLILDSISHHERRKFERDLLSIS
jgi:glycosyltransferase involved in cell wall biosynthesis